ncbi:hypothetical protein [Planotetraspora sp. GP83]|uniref:hypothetical protein n=1 Tax=Planotetraspora sp. GP83 TaxID=3156264 RepID=UPI003516317F
MRRTIAALACAAAATLIAPAVAAPAHAQAGAADPAVALKKQFVTGHGVHFTSVGKISIGGFSSAKLRQKGDVEFARAGVSASDVTTKIDFGGSLGDDEDLQGLDDPTRTITVKKNTYVSGGMYADVLPDGKTWLRMPGGDAAGSVAGNNFIDPLNPQALKAVLATAKAHGNGGVIGGAKTTLYRGAITLQQLAASTPSLKNELKALGPESRKTVVSWKLWVGSDSLVRRLSTSTSLKYKTKKVSFTLDVAGTLTFTGWGSKIHITPPPSDQVADVSDIDGTVPDMPDYINLGD